MESDIENATSSGEQHECIEHARLLAHCVSFGINALYERPNPFSATGITERGLVCYGTRLGENRFKNHFNLQF